MQGLSAEAVALSPAPGCRTPIALDFSPNGAKLSFLYGFRNAGRQLCEYAVQECGDAATPRVLVDLSSGSRAQAALSLEEELMRERQRISAVGVVSYAWLPDSQQVMVPADGDILLFKDGQERVLYSRTTAGPALDPHMSPDGRKCAFVLKSDLCVIYLENPDEIIRVAPAEEEGVTNGLADYIAQEEMDRYRGFWWSPDSQQLLFTSVDERRVPSYTITRQGKDVVEEEHYKYPFVGGANPAVKLGVVTVPLRQASDNCYDQCVRWLRICDEGLDHYIARAGWWPDGSVMVQVQSRDQLTLDVKRIDVGSETVVATTLVRETSTSWINLHDMLTPLSCDWRPPYSPNEAADTEGFYFIWASERSGFCHLYLYHVNPDSQTADCVQTLTSGDWVVDSVEAVDEQQHIVYFSGSLDSALEKHLYAVPLWQAGGSSIAPQRLTRSSGFHSVRVSVESNVFVDLCSSMTTPYQMVISRLNDAIADRGPDAPCCIWDGTDARCEQLRRYLTPPEIYHIPTRDDQTPLHTSVRVPDPAIHGMPPYPAVVMVYGGPGVQRVTNSWAKTANLRALWYVDQGFVVLECDNRGSCRRGVAFEGKIKNRLAEVELQDQEDALRFFISKGLIDERRIGITGWSYGGYLSLMAICKYPALFQAAVAGAPVVSWDGYDTHYTERIMSTPHQNPVGYANSNVLTHLAGMSGKLMLMHGMMDENVHFRHTARLINGLTAHRKLYDLVIFPDERHSPRDLKTRIYLEERMRMFFVQVLRPAVSGVAPRPLVPGLNSFGFGASPSSHL